MLRRALAAIAWLSLLFSLACSPALSPPAPDGARSAKAGGVAARPPGAGPAPEAPPSDAPQEEADPGPVPVTRADPARGSRLAPVTIVVFSDFECPYCKHLAGTLRQLEQRYGPERLRIAWKNFPLAFHKRARPSAEAAMAVFAHAGASAFWAFHDAIFQADERLSPEVEATALRRAGVTPGQLEQLLEKSGAARKVDADMALAARLGVTGTPASFINGVPLVGAQPAARFAAIIDAQLVEARALRDEGTPPAQVYAALTKKNLAAAAAAARDDAGDEDSATVHLVPVGDSPVRGEDTALVTLVMFGDYQCPFCGRVMPTIEKLTAQYGDRLRVVWKDNPLSFHARAEPAAELAREARAQKGDAAFWQAHERLLSGQGTLDDAALEAVAAELKLNVAAAKRAVASRKHAARIDADMELADDLGVRGTPHFFINGRSLAGARPIEEFQAIIDEEIQRAEALVVAGTPRAAVYEAIQKQAVPPAPPPKVSVPPPPKGHPGKGAAAGKVVIQVFADFQCPYCARGAATMDALLKAFPGKVRVVFRHMPLPFHPDAQLAAEASMEALAQKGPPGFWKMHDLLFEDTASSNLDRAALERHAALLGLDAARFTRALDERTHRAAVEADAAVARGAGINGTPAFVINGYLVSGAQPLVKFKKVVRRALGEAG
ncbi:DSBA oxidoreductase [Sorangium cellulosum]|uniref:DSBA oxidoreductase n=1 Tax=Sorangium cellulosum TaxID=56 RepID=A0A4P2QEJ4_SORCE|nr:thioredoxin domain-containing protein [Sorangium cellulosum]AUX27603.1 DSBA oxidoreductase [Sorangium cellulosum]